MIVVGVVMNEIHGQLAADDQFFQISLLGLGAGGSVLVLTRNAR